MMDAVCGRFIIDSLVMRKCDAESKDRCYHKVAYIKRMYNNVRLFGGPIVLYRIG